MGLDIFDFMSAAGAGLGEVAKVKQEDKKQKLHEKLKIEDEARAESRQVAREQRQETRDLNKVARTEIITKEGGLMYERDVNSRGEPLNERPVDQYRLEEINRERKKGDASLEATLAQTESSRASTARTRQQMQYEPGEHDMQRRVQEAQIRNYDEKPQGRAPAKGDAPTDTSLGSLTEYMIDKNQDLYKSYVKDDGSGMTPADFRKIAQETIKIARANKQDARMLFADALERFGKPRKGK